ncbi:hypothetical protein [Nonomuraea sp. NPDC049695]|uniref:hypothetical protein n=1 Tax=Nonomuraea sp. NPDC049695 TaxID=3154734 RepID=UPI003440011C
MPPGKKVSDPERWRTGPSKASGPQIVNSLDLVAESGGTGLGRLELDAAAPQRRLNEPARYGLTAHSGLKKHPASRRLATLLATAQRLETIDDTLELLDLLMVTELLGKAQREADKQKVVKHPRLAKASPGWPRRWRCCWRPRRGARTCGCSRCGR